ncbi:MAG: ABC transporter substrate-binding protein [Lachnospiraceae bacterium]|nr:ABC transporter substrate-binding protein [Lachnospiraceae bacterium]
MKKLLAILLAGAMILGLAACGKEPAASEGSSDSNVETAGEVVNTSVEVDENKTYKETIILGYEQPVTTLDCQVLVNGVQDTVYYLFVNALLSYNYETKQLEPCLAKEWSNNEDSTVWTFKLRDDVTFSNGEPLTADDVVFTIERMAESGVSGAADAKNVESVVANGDYEVVVTLKSANMDFPYRMGLAFWGILNREAVEADPDNGFKVGTGGWKPVKFEPGVVVEFEKVETSWVWKDVQTPTKKIVLKTMTEESARSIAVQTDEIQFSYQINYGDTNIYDADPNVDYMIIDAEAIYYLGMSYESEAIGDDVNLRNAIAYAINPQELKDVGFAGKGKACQTFWGPNQYGLYTDYEQPLGQNLELAKEYMAKSNHPDGVTLTITTVTAFEEMAEVVQAQLAEIGITVKVNITDAPGLAQTVADKKLDLLLYNKTCGAYGDQFRDILVYGNTANRMKYNNEKVAELLDKALGETDDAARKALYQEVQEITHEEMPCVPLFYGTNSVLFRKGLSGVKYQPNLKHDFTYVICEDNK